MGARLLSALGWIASGAVLPLVTLPLFVTANDAKRYLVGHALIAVMVAGSGLREWAARVAATREE
ncbi:MAG: hypothetical protein AAFU79_13095 [Myxococcota bacterium]